MNSNLDQHHLLEKVYPNYRDFDGVDDIVFIIDNQFNIHYANQFSLNQLEYSAEELSQIGFRNLADIFETNFDDFHEVRKSFGVFNRLRLNGKGFNLVSIHAEILKREVDGTNYYVIISNANLGLGKVDFLASDIFFHSSDAMAICSLDSIVLSVNNAFTKLFGYLSNEIKGKNIVDLLSPNNEKVGLIKMHSTVLNGHTVNFQSRRFSRDKKVLDLEISIVPIKVNDKIIGSQIIYRDIANIIVKGQNALTFDALAKNFLDGIVITDSTGMIHYINEAFTEMSGYSLHDVNLMRPVELFRSFYHDENYYNGISNSLRKSGKWQGEIWNRQKDGTLKPYWLQIFSINSEDGITLRYVAIYKDLASINVNKKILAMLGKDPLTTIPNRTKFLEEVENTIMDFPLVEHTLFFIDINEFKCINDEYGHAIGDKILIEYSKRMKNCFKDKIIARYGGDEFVAFMETPDDYNEMIKKLKDFTKSLTNLEVANKKFSLSVSVGLATYPSDSRDVNDLIDKADQAMYVSKKSGINFHKYSE